jgi:hypothetical protein
MKIDIYDHLTGKVISREMTAEEKTNFELVQNEAEKQAEIEAQKAKLKANIINKLGLTADEVAALLS